MNHLVRLLTLCSILEGLVKPYRNGPKSDLKYYRWKKPIEEFGLDWIWFEGVVDYFDCFRNEIAHGFEDNEHNNDFRKVLEAYYAISAAIYTVMAKQMGWNGAMQKSQADPEEYISLA